MGEEAGGRTSVAPALALPAFLFLVAVLENAFGTDGLSIAGAVILQDAAALTVIHWSLGFLVLGSLFAGGTAPRVAAAAAGAGLFGFGLLGVAARDATAHALGFEGALPWSYAGIHLAMAAVGLVGARFPARPEGKG